MNKKESINIVIEATRKYLKGAGVGIMSFPQGEERKKIEEAIENLTKHSSFIQNCTECKRVMVIVEDSYYCNNPDCKNYGFGSPK